MVPAQEEAVQEVDISSKNQPWLYRIPFEKLKYNILMFTQESQYNWRLAGGFELDRNEIDQQWTRMIQGIYPAGDPKSYELLAQVECPMYDGYWVKRADEKAFHERERCKELGTFKESCRKPTQAQKSKWPGSILIKDHEFEEILVPRILRLALQQLNYLDFVKSVLQANPLIKKFRFTMHVVWATVITRIYHFEDPLDKELKIGEKKECTPATYHALAEDYQSAYEVAKASLEAKWAPQERKKRERERTASQEESGGDGHDRVEKELREIYDHHDRAGKRQKTQDPGGYIQVEGTNNEARNQTEQEEVGTFHFDEAAWTNFEGE